MIPLDVMPSDKSPLFPRGLGHHPSEVAGLSNQRFHAVLLVQQLMSAPRQGRSLFGVCSQLIQMIGDGLRDNERGLAKIDIKRRIPEHTFRERHLVGNDDTSSRSSLE
jgi:hypothetical protein